jgi:uncharacterized membrane protein YeaQ/YmgE (transglycosylase-associated protein family)
MPVAEESWFRNCRTGGVLMFNGRGFESMVFINCLWVGALAGLVGSRLIRAGRGYVPVATSTAVGVLGALVGGLAGLSLRTTAGSLPHQDILAAGGGASLALILWAIAYRLFLAPPSQP